MLNVWDVDILLGYLLDLRFVGTISVATLPSTNPLHSGPQWHLMQLKKSIVSNTFFTLFACFLIMGGSLLFIVPAFFTGFRNRVALDSSKRPAQYGILVAHCGMTLLRTNTTFFVASQFKPKKTHEGSPDEEGTATSLSELTNNSFGTDLQKSSKVKGGSVDTKGAGGCTSFSGDGSGEEKGEPRPIPSTLILA